MASWPCCCRAPSTKSRNRSRWAEQWRRKPSALFSNTAATTASTFRAIPIPRFGRLPSRHERTPAHNDRQASCTSATERRLRRGPCSRKPPYHILAHPDDPKRAVTVPVHGNRDLKPGTLRSILRQAGLTAEELRDLL